VLTGGDVAETLIGHVGTRQRSLLVMASHGAHPLSGATPANVTRRVLARTIDPVLLVGARGEPPGSEVPPVLIVAVDGPDPMPSTIDAVERFVHSFAIATTWAVEVVPTSIDDAGRGRGDVHRWRSALEARDVPTEVEVIHGGDPVAGLDEFTEELPNVVYVATTCRYCDGRRHLHSTTRDLVHRSRRPVLVVSGDREVADLAAADPPGVLHPLHSWSPPRTVRA
jgi:nucleotide-binding universal stress UspA family protein